MRFRPIALSVMLACATPAMAQLSINFGSPGVSIGINLPVYPTLQRVPGYPVYYAPGVSGNYFFYDGLYWVYEGDAWYSSSWYNGPWRAVDRFYVPDYVLRVPVRYYRQAPAYFRGWRADAAPRWGEHWGASWEQRRGGWDRWNRSSAPAPAPLPTYQRQYSGNRYPQAVEQQSAIVTRNYRYQPRDTVAREQFQYQRSRVQAAPAPQPQPQPQPQVQQRRQQAQPQPQVQQQQPAPQPPVQQRRQQAQPQVQQQQAAPQPQPQAQQRRYQGQPLPQQGQPQVKQQPAPQANPAARAPAPQPQNAPDKGNQGKGQERGKGKGRDKDKDKDKD